MSTRSMIKFKSGDEVVFIYKHSDGYPSSTMSDLDEFFKWDGVNSRGLSYTIANFVTYFKVQNAMTYGDNKDIMTELKKPDHNGQLHLGYGINANMNEAQLLDSWCEWYYVVDFDKLKIEVFTLGYEPKKIIPAGHSRIMVDKQKSNFGGLTYRRLEHSARLVKKIEAI